MKKKIYALPLFFMLFLVACGDNEGSIEDQNEVLKTEIDNLKTEIDTLKTNKTDMSLVEDTEIALTEEVIVGEWFNYGEFDESTHRINFNVDGNGEVLTTEYVWHDSTLMRDDPNDTGEYIHEFKWNFENGIVKMIYKNENEDKVDFTFIESEQQLHVINKEGDIVERFSRELPTIPDGYVKTSSILNKQKGFQQAFMGEWHFDVFIWTFYEDGKLIVDVPAFGQYPADKLEYEFMLLEDPYGEVDGLLTIDHPTNGLVIYEATFGNQSGGSLTLKPRPDGNGNSILLTKSFSLQNSPITDEILDEGMALFDAFEAFTPFGKRR